MTCNHEFKTAVGNGSFDHSFICFECEKAVVDIDLDAYFDHLQGVLETRLTHKIGVSDDE